MMTRVQMMKVHAWWLMIQNEKARPTSVTNNRLQLMTRDGLLLLLGRTRAGGQVRALCASICYNFAVWSCLWSWSYSLHSMDSFVQDWNHHNLHWVFVNILLAYVYSRYTYIMAKFCLFLIYQGGDHSRCIWSFQPWLLDFIFFSGKLHKVWWIFFNHRATYLMGLWCICYGFMSTWVCSNTYMLHTCFLYHSLYHHKRTHLLYC